MKLRQLFSHRRSAQRSSLTGVLPRVQRMRQSCEWEPVVSPEAIGEREQRLTDARKRIVWQPVAFDHTATRNESKDGTKRLTWMLALIIVAVTAYLCAWFYFEPPFHQLPPRIGRSFSYRLAAPPAYLSESLAISVAHEAMKENGLNVSDLNPSTNNSSFGSVPVSSRDGYLLRSSPSQGDLFFTRGDGQQEYQVAVMLMGHGVWCTIFTNLSVPVRQPLK